jgi:hypothetical protein
MAPEKQSMGNPLEDFKSNMGKLGSKKAQTSSKTDAQQDRKEDIQTDKGKSGRIKTGYSLDRNLIKQARRLALDEEVDVNDLIEEALRLLFEERKKRAGS